MLYISANDSIAWCVYQRRTFQTRVEPLRLFSPVSGVSVVELGEQV